MGTGEQLRLQANFGNELGGQLQMTPTTDALLQLRYDPSPMLRRDSSLWPSSSPRGAWALPSTLLCGARTFLWQLKHLPATV